ncbi:TetR/AcrR family transcriptional regulator [Bacteroidota bacterium]
MAESYDTKKQKIIDQAKQIFGQLGFNKTTLDDIAEAVGMKKNSLYYYFENKEKLFTELFYSEMKKIEEGQTEILIKCKSSRSKIEELIKYTLDVHSTRSLAVRTFTIKAFFEIKRFLQSDIEKFKIKQTRRFEEIFREGVKNKEFKKHNSAILAENIVSVMNALMAFEFNKAKVNYVHEIDFVKVNSTMLGILKHILDGIETKQ